MTIRNLDAIFRPQSVALIGASPSGNNAMLALCRALGFKLSVPSRGIVHTTLELSADDT